jgi:O-antigen ligase
MALPFAFTLSRAAYVGVVPAFLVMAWLTRQRKFMVGLLLLLIVCSPILAFVAPTPVTQRILYTFEPEKGQATVRLGHVALDPSTSARLISFRTAVEGFARRPIFGYGVTGFAFMDAQYARVLVETGLVGLAAFLALVWAVLKSGMSAFRSLREDEDRGLALGFVAGTVGLLIHAIGSNTFIIVRIMEPFWFFAGVIVMLPQLAREESRTPVAAPPATAGGVRGPLRLPR